MLNFDVRINLRFAVIGQLVAYTPDAVTAQNLISRLQTAIRLFELSELVHAKYCLHYWCVAKLLNANICVSVTDPLHIRAVGNAALNINSICIYLLL